VLVDTVLLELTRDELAKHLGRSPNAAMTILSEMADRLRETNTQLSQPRGEGRRQGVRGRAHLAHAPRRTGWRASTAAGPSS